MNDREGCALAILFGVIALVAVSFIVVEWVR